MREAVGEANITIVTIILIGTILPMFYVIIPNLLNSMQDRACCVQNNGKVDSSKCLIYFTDKDYLDYGLSGFRSHCN